MEQKIMVILLFRLWVNLLKMLLLFTYKYMFSLASYFDMVA